LAFGGQYRYGSDRAGVFILGDDPREFEDHLDLYASISEAGSSARVLDWSVSSAGQNPGDADEGSYSLQAGPDGIRGSFLGVYAGGIPPIAWTTDPPLFLPVNWAVGLSWETGGSGKGVDEHRGPYTDKFEMEATIVGERSVDLDGQPYHGVSIDRSWLAMRSYDRSRKEERVKGTQSELFSPAAGLVLCSSTDTELSGGHRVSYRVELYRAKGCPGG